MGGRRLGPASSSDERRAVACPRDPRTQISGLEEACGAAFTCHGLAEKLAGDDGLRVGSDLYEERG
jgi:hypothetical protein